VQRFRREGIWHRLDIQVETHRVYQHGPEKVPLDQLARRVMAANNDSRQVLADV
jgi:hypothetical protein